nr:BsuBI/PstI family type II restriction endonuclease [Luteimonas sp. MHLX1A]
MTHAEIQRREVHGATPREHKSAMGQFMTPASVASFMAGLFKPQDGELRLLDAGAGLGALTCATLDRWKAGELGRGRMTVHAHEMDDRLRAHLQETLARYTKDGVEVVVNHGDYLAQAADSIERGEAPYSHAILNPPYKKIGTESDARQQARRAGLETVNLYSAFVGLALAQMSPGGQLVAIIPRSFANGPYYKPFRRFILERAALRRIHLFDSRNKAFRDDEVLQENIIVLLERGATQGEVVVSHSTDDTFDDIRQQTHAFSEVVKPNDPDVFVHVPDGSQDALEESPNITATIRDLGIGVSTGPIVDFRAKEHLRYRPEPGTVPLLYPQHFTGQHTTWPVAGKKPNAIARHPEVERSLWPAGRYVVVRRFSSKEERRRVVASLVDPDALGNPEVIGFENHLNVYHDGKCGLSEDLAWGLFVYLNSAALDEHLRRFSGHTQVNATDLKNIRYPTRERLERLGAWARHHPLLTQEEIDIETGDLLLSQQRIDQATQILAALGFPRAQLNDRSALCLLALLGMKPDDPWSDAGAGLIGITPIMDFAREHYGRDYKPNTRETFRRQSMHQFVDGGLALYNPDEPDRPVNSPKAVYQIVPEALELIRCYGTAAWEANLATYRAKRQSLAAQYARARELKQVPVVLPEGGELLLSPGEHSQLIKAVVEVFGGHFAPGAHLIYAGDTGNKVGFFDRETLEGLGVVVDKHGKMPDVVLYDARRNWLLLIEAASSHGPVDGKRYGELHALFGQSTAGLVLVSAFSDRATMRKYLADIAWETEVWVADAPTHMMHFNGERFLGPY